MAAAATAAAMAAAAAAAMAAAAAATAAAEAGVLRGVNEVLRFVQALDRVDTEGVEPMWTPLRQSHAAPLRSDEVAGKEKKNQYEQPELNKKRIIQVKLLDDLTHV